MNKGNEYEISASASTKLYLSKDGGSGNFKPSDIVVTFSVLGRYPATVEKKEAVVEIRDYLTEMGRMVIMEVPRIVDGSLASLADGSLSIPSSPKGGAVKGSAEVTISKGTEGTEGVTTQKATNTPSGNTPAGLKIPTAQSGNQQPQTSQQKIDQADLALSKVTAALQKLQGIAPYNKLLYGAPVDDASAYLGIKEKVERWGGEMASVEDWLTAYTDSGLLVRHWKDIMDIIYSYRRVHMKEQSAPFTFDNWKDIMEYMASKGWVKRGPGDPKKNNKYFPGPYPGYTPKN
jgi:hypothetical protein